MYRAIFEMQNAFDPHSLWKAVKKFNGLRIKMPHDTIQSAVWIDAYKGSGAFFTMQNMIRFHNCFVVNDFGKQLSKNNALSFLNKKAEEYKKEGWRLIGVLKKMLDDNNIDVADKIREWRK